MHYKSNHRFRKLWECLILAAFLLIGCAPAQPAMTGSPDLKQGTISDLQSSAEPESGKNYLTFLQMIVIDQEQGWLLVRYGVAMGSEADGVFQTTNGGVTWKPLATSMPKEGENDDTAECLPFGGIKNGIMFSDPVNGWLSGSTHGDGIYFYQTADGGVTWNLKTLTVPAGYSTSGGSANSDTPVFFSGQSGVLPVEFRGQTPTALVFYLTTNGRKNWQTTTPLLSSREPFRGFRTAVVDAGHAYVSDGYALFYSADGMRTYTPVATDLDLDNLNQLDFILLREKTPILYRW